MFFFLSKAVQFLKLEGFSNSYSCRDENILCLNVGLSLFGHGICKKKENKKA